MSKKKYQILFLIACIIIIALATLFLLRYALKSEEKNGIIISEIIPSNKTLLADEYDHYFDMVELYNSGDTAVDITAFGLTDNIERLHRWTFPETVIEPGEYIIVYLSGDDFQPEDGLYANFALDSDGEAVILTDFDRNIIQAVPYGAMDADMSYSFIEDEYVYVQMGTPGQPNTGEAVSNVKAEIEVNEPEIFGSVPPGVYGEPVYLKLESETDLEIRYTLDGTAPTIESEKYNIQLFLDYSSNNPLQYANIQSTFYEIEHIDTRFVEKATIVKAQHFDGETPVGKMFVGTYFIWNEGAERYDFDLVSIVADPGDLFDPYVGIYTVGDFFLENYKYGYGGGTPANYNRRGDNWEREARVEFFGADGEVILSQNVGIRMFGDWSRSFPKKSMKLVPRKDYDEYGKLFYPFFDGLTDINGEPIDAFERLVLRSGAQDWEHAMFTDLLVDTMAEGILDYQAYKPVVLFLNGEYWGIYHLREHMNEDYISDHFDVDKDDVAIIVHQGIPEIYSGDENDKAHYLKMLDFAADNDLSEEANYLQMESMIDIQNFINYYCVELFIMNEDWPGNNVKVWRYTKEAKVDNPYTDGKYRFLLYDTEYSCDLYGSGGDYKRNMFEIASDLESRQWPNPWWSNILFVNLMENDAFKERFLTTYADYLNSRFSGEEIVENINKFAEMYRPEMEEYINRYHFNAVADVDEWQTKEVDRLIEFAQNRAEYVFSTARNYYNLDGFSLLDIKDFENGVLNINGNYTVEEEKTVKYFNEYEIKIEAVADNGYTFDSWIISSAESGDIVLNAQNTSSSDGKYRLEDNVLYVVPDGDVSLRVIFK